MQTHPLADQKSNTSQIRHRSLPVRGWKLGVVFTVFGKSHADAAQRIAKAVQNKGTKLCYSSVHDSYYFCSTFPSATMFECAMKEHHKTTTIHINQGDATCTRHIIMYVYFWYVEVYTRAFNTTFIRHIIEKKQDSFIMPGNASIKYRYFSTMSIPKN